MTQETDENGYCVDCPDHEACYVGTPCYIVKDVAARVQNRSL